MDELKYLIMKVISWAGWIIMLYVLFYGNHYMSQSIDMFHGTIMLIWAINEITLNSAGNVIFIGTSLEDDNS